MVQQKNIVICSDGTGNTAIKGRGTNVFKIFEAVDTYGHWTDPALPPQVAIYDDGVGTEKFKLLRLLGGIGGLGLSRNIRQLYTELARCYEPGDQIYLFGFSRGAFTVRSLAGFIGTCGLLDKHKPTNDNLPKRVVQAYKKYRSTFNGDQTAKADADQFRREFSVVHEEHAPDGLLKIAFIGVWDTVDAVGTPLQELTWLLNKLFRFKFPDHVLCNHVQRACHALSIDDQRYSFHPLLWDETKEAENNWLGRIEQVWFPGVHSNVGGGYPKQGMSMVSLYWMMHKAREYGLRFVAFDWEQFRDHQNPFDKLYDSRAGFAIYYRYLPRDIGALCRRNGTLPKIHVSAVERIIQGTDGYAPGNIPAGCQFVATESPPDNLPAIAAAISAALHPQSTLLDRCRRQITLRHYSHLLFLAASLAAVVLLLRDTFALTDGRGLIDDASSWSRLLQLAQCLMLNPALYITLLGIIILFALLAWLLRKDLESDFACFWQKLHEQLQKKLYPNR